MSTAAFAPVVPRGRGGALQDYGDAAPLASLFARLGAPRTDLPARSSPPAAAGRIELLLFAVAMLGFLAEWASRRLRGAA